MSLRIELLTESLQQEYENFLLSLPSVLLYASPAYEKFLRRILANSEPKYLIAYDGSRIVGALPLFIKYSARLGNVLNSLPFYGSNGGAIVSNAVSDTDAVKKALFQACTDLASQCNVAVQTVISNPLESHNFYDTYLPHTFRDERIGQITPLPHYDGNDEFLINELMGKFHKKTRNSIRKAMNGNFFVSHSDSPVAVQQLSILHRQNIEAVGGLYKPLSVFSSIREVFQYDAQYRIYVAERNDQIIAALLVFFYNKTAEYFTPAVLEEYRSEQPISLLILEGMKDAVRRGYMYWNWGGTWLSQTGVYNFKKRWGTEDMRYYYYTTVYDDEILYHSKEKLTEEFSYFYVAPFEHLKKG